MKLLPIGRSNFKEIIEENFYYIDKSLLIDEITNTSGKVILITRPRRFGKTLNLSMLKYFYEISESNNQHLFYDTAIWQYERYRELQGIFPLIFITFKDIKSQTWQQAYDDIIVLIIEEFKRHAEFLLSKLSTYDHADYESILYRTASEADYSSSLLFLSRLLTTYHGQKVVILIDEYDTLIHAAYANGYYKELVNFMQKVLSKALKDNDFLERGVLTGILRTAKEGIFSGLNHLDVFTILHEKFSDKFGFVAPEVDQMLIDYGIEHDGEAVKSWYNSYTCGKVALYNPWSILQCVQNKGLLKAYWSNTSDNYLIKKLIAGSSSDMKTELESLLTGTSIKKQVEERLVFPTLEQSSHALWSLLLWAGYLTYTSHEVDKESRDICTLILPNKEIKILYQKQIEEIFEQSLSVIKIHALFEALIDGNVPRITEFLQDFVISSMSVFDIPDTEPEKSYHLFVLGLLVTLRESYEIKSNRESGYGRYDIMLIPKDITKPGYIIEFKKVSTYTKETLEEAAKKALMQIEEKQYVQELQDRGIYKTIALGIAFKGKQIMVLSDLVVTASPQ